MLRAQVSTCPTLPAHCLKAYDLAAARCHMHACYPRLQRPHSWAAPSQFYMVCLCRASAFMAL